MRRKKRKNGKIIFGILFVAALGVVGFLCYDKFFKTEEKEPEPGAAVVTPTPIEEPNRAPVDSPSEPVVTKEPVVQYDGDNPNLSEELTGAITYAGATADNAIIRVNIDQYIDGGTCSLSIGRGSDIIYRTTANLIADVTTSTCEGFNISRSELSGASGNYDITIKLVSGDKTGTIGGELSL